MGTGDLMSVGTTHSCGNNIPDLPLNAVGQSSVCAPNHTCGNTVQPQILPATFDAIKRSFPVNGMQTSWNPGGTITASATTALLGLAQSSTYQNAATAWPPYCASNCTPSGSFSMSDVTDDDGDGNPGITAIPKADPCDGTGPCKYTLPPTAIALATIPPEADQLYLVSRSNIAISAKRMNDCTHGSGTATVTAFDNHIVGCHIKGGGACTSDQVSFIDQNRTVYGPDANNVVSSSHPIMGTATLVQLPAGSTCADARKIN
jgi:hypothetical protein